MAYTSNSEFDAETRVQKTNEIRPVDIYEGVHSTLKNDIWKWLLGWTDVTTGLDYNPLIPAEDENSPSKTINGKVAEAYGEKTRKVWDPISESYYTANLKNQTRLEIDGALLPEHDLFLHEIYRYLSNLYPDHPDWVELLTHNEIVDAFENAAAMVDYKPDDKFFMIAAQNMESVSSLDNATSSEIEEIKKEELKLLLRNLTNNSYRRKFYGSSDGLKMFAKGIGVLTSTFPVGEYIPLKTKNEEDAIDTLNLKTDIFDPNFRKPFRIMDWEGTSHKVPDENTSKIEFAGYCYPGHERGIIELHNIEETLTDTSSIKQVVDSNTFFNIPEVQHGISYIDSIAPRKTKTYTQLINDDTDYKLVNSDIGVFEYFTSKRLPIKYAEFYNYGKFPESIDLTNKNDSIGLQEIIQKAWKDHELSYEEVIDTLVKRPEAQDAIFHSIFNYKYPKKILYTVNPLTNGIILEPKNMLPIYGEKPIYEKIKNVWYLKKDHPEIPNNFIINKNEIVSSSILKDSADYALSEISGVNKGILKISCKNAYIPSDIPPKNWGEFTAYINNPEYHSSVYKYGLIINTLNKKKVVVEGSMKCIWTSDTFIQPKEITFFIEDIPTYKTDDLCRYIYEDFDSFDEKEKEECRKNREILTFNESFISNDTKKEVYYNTLNFEVGSVIDRLYKYQIKTSYDTKQPDLETVEVEGIPNTGNIQNIDFGYLSFVTFLENKNNKSINSFNRTSQYEIPLDVTPQETMKRFYDTSKLEIKVQPSKLYNPITLIGYVSSAKDTLLNIENKDDLSLNILGSYFWETFTKSIAPKNNTNIIAESPSFYKILISASKPKNTINENETAQFTLVFSNSEDIKKFEILSVGDKVEGNGLPADTFITKIGHQEVILNNKITREGEGVYKFYCKCEAFPNNIEEDFTHYKTVLKSCGSLVSANPWDNGLWGSNDWPHVSRSFIDGLVDPQDFAPSNTYTTNFEQVMKAVYNNKIEKNKILLPSTIVVGNLIFYEININKKIIVPNRLGNINNLMNVEWLDYLENNLHSISQASENTNVGVNLTLQTDMTGFYSLTQDSSFTDSDLDIKFQTFNYTLDTIPCYAQVGTGGSGFQKYFKLPTETLKPNVYGAAFYDKERPDIAIEAKELEDKAGRQKRRFTYSKGDPVFQSENLKLDRVESPLFEVPLGEYDVQKKFIPTHSQSGKNFDLSTDTVSVSVNKQTYKDLTKILPEDRIQILNESYTSYRFIDDDSYIYEGEWKPELNSENTDFSYPLAKKEWDTSKVHYFSIFSETSNYIKGELKVIKGTTLLVYTYYEAEGWKFEHYSCEFGGVTFSPKSKKLGYNGIYKKEIINDEEKFSPLYFVTTDKSLDWYTGKDSELDDKSPENIAKINAALHANYIRGGSSPILPYYNKEEVTKILEDLYDYCIIHNKYFLVAAQATLTENQGPITLDYYILSFINVERGDCPKVLKVDQTIFSASINFESASHVSELSVFNAGVEELYSKDPELEADDTRAYTQVSLDSDLEIIMNHQNTFKLPRSFVTDGSYNIELTLDPQFISEGYLYTGSNKPDFSKKVFFNVSQSKIYYDDINKCFYTFADLYIDGKEEGKSLSTRFTKDTNHLKEKVALSFKEQKFFKNVKYIPCIYKVHEEVKEKDKNSKKIATLTGIKGESFDLNKLSSSDRILSMNEVKLKSNYFPGGEPVTFSRFTTFKGELYGIDEDNRIFISNFRTGEENQAINKSKYSIEVRKFSPTYIKDGRETDVFENPYHTFDDKIPAPSLSSIEIKKPASKGSILQHNINDTEAKDLEDKLTNFRYFKNYLVFEGKIDLENSNKIITSTESDIFNRALTKISNGDTVVEAIPLENTALQSRKSIIIKDPQVDTQPLFVKYKNGILAVVCFKRNEGAYIFEKKINSLAAIFEINKFDEVYFVSYSNSMAKVQNFEINENSTYTISFTSGNITQVYEAGRNGTFEKYNGVDHIEIENTPVVIPVLRGSVNQTGFGNVFTGLYDVVYSKDLSMTAYKTEVQSRTLYFESTDNKKEKTYYDDIQLKNKVTLIRTSTLENEEETENPNIKKITEKVKVASITESPYVKDTENNRAWYTSDSNYEVFIRGKDHCFIKSPSSFKDDSGTIRSNISHWKEGHIPSMSDTLLQKITSANVIDVENRLIEAVEGYRKWLKGASNLTELQALHKKILVTENRQIYTFDQFSKLKNSSGNYQIDSSHKVPLKFANGKWIVNTSSSKTYKFETNVKGVILHEDVYKDYVYDWIHYIIGGSDGEPGDYILSSNIKNSIVNNSILYLLLENEQVISYKLNEATTSDSISNGNWKGISTPPLMYYPTSLSTVDINKKMSGTPAIVYWEQDGALKEGYQNLISDLLPIYHFTSSYIKDNTIFYIGYFDSLAEIRKNLGREWKPGEKELYAEYCADSKNLPAVFYCNGNSPFEVILTKDILAKDSEISVLQSNIKAIAACEKDGKVLVSLRDDTNGKELNKKLQISFNENNEVINSALEVDYPKLVIPTGVKTLLAENTATKSDGGKIIVYSEKHKGIIHETETINDYTFDYIFDSILSFETIPKVSLVNNNSVTLTSNLVNSKNLTGTKRFLFAIKTAQSISNQFEYLSHDKSQDYIGENGQFKVSTQEEVEGSTYADKIYSYRNVGIGLTDDIGYPSEEEDTENKYYKYDEEKSPILQKNINDDNIYYCNSQGELLLGNSKKKELRNESSFYSIEKWISGSGDIPEFSPSATPKILNTLKVTENLDYLKSDQEMEELLKNLKFTFYEYNYGEESTLDRKSKSYIMVETKDNISVPKIKNELIKVTKEVFENYKKYYLEDKENLTNKLDQYIEEIISSGNEENISTIKYIQSEISFIVENEGAWGSIENPIEDWTSKLSIKTYGNETFLFDSILNIYLLKNIRYFSSKVKVPYKSRAKAEVLRISPQQPMILPGFRVIDMGEGHLPVSSIYFPLNGYGGTRDGLTKGEWTEGFSPWTNDPDAFYLTRLLRNTEGEMVYLCDSSGTLILNSAGNPIPVRVPRYTTFKSLCEASKGFTKTENFIERTNDVDFINFGSIDTQAKKVDLMKPLSEDLVFNKKTVKELNYNDLKEHIFLLKVLTVSDIELEDKELNDLDNIIEISKNEIDKFPPNRVYFNPLGIPQPPVEGKYVKNGTIGKTYRSENNYAFYNKKYTNKNNIPIYQCNENGKYIEYYVSKEGKFDLRELEVPTIESLFNPALPVYNTCEDWFKSEFYLKNDESNPFWQVIKVYPEFNRTLKKFISKSKIFEYVKSTSKMALAEPDPSEIYIDMKRTSLRQKSNNLVTITPNASFIDLVPGEVYFILSQPGNTTFKDKESFVKFGISYINSFYEKNGLHKNIWVNKSSEEANNGVINLPSTLKVSYTVNSKEDFSDPTNKDAGITQITEFALFDKNHKMIAYATFPPIEYRSDTQHISFTCFINHGPCNSYQKKDLD